MIAGRTRFRLCLVLAVFSSSSEARAAPGDIFVTFMARPTAPISKGTPGHAFICVSLDLNQGIKEECFGFYPKDLSKVFWGPGEVSNEFTTSAIPHVSVSLKHQITEEGRRAVYKSIKRWAGADYGLLVQNCGDFVFDVAEAAGLRLPPRSELLLPTEFVEALRGRYWSGSWLSTDAQSRFGLLISGTDVDWTERAQGGSSLTKRASLSLLSDAARIERRNTDDVLAFLGYQPNLRGQVLAAGPSPSFMLMRRIDARVIADWNGLLVIKDEHANLKELKQPGTFPAKRFDLDRLP